jgi:hypothetical protein
LVLSTLWTAAYATVVAEDGWVLWIPALLVLGVRYFVWRTLNR